MDWREQVGYLEGSLRLEVQMSLLTLLLSSSSGVEEMNHE